MEFFFHFSTTCAIFTTKELKMKNLWLYILICVGVCSCKNTTKEGANQLLRSGVVVLGIAQDAGFPQADCKKDCCKLAWKTPDLRRHATCLALFDSLKNQFWLFDATPDIKFQMNHFQQLAPDAQMVGIFLTHAHVGHYTGLMHLGHEVMGAKNLPVFAMPRMRTFLSENGPWSQLVDFKNIELQNLSADTTINLNVRFSVSPFRVPHRDEFSETVGYKISTPEKSYLFIPDIDKWHLWQRNIIEEIAKVDVAFLDGSFYKNGEIPGRDMSQIPHPFVEESMKILENLSESEKAKVHFIHFNHTNPALQANSEARKEILGKGFKISEEGDVY